MRFFETALAACLLLIFLHSAAGSPAAEDEAKVKTGSDGSGLRETIHVFESGRNGYSTYRIPSVVVAPDGSLLAFCEGRRKSSSDTGDIDLLMKRSIDGGASWSEQEVVWDDGPNTCGNPCPVVDRKKGTISLLMTHNLGIDHESRIIKRQSRGTRTVWVCRSDNSGRTWSQPREITAAVKEPNWTWYATGPGAGIRIERGPHEGRLVVPCDHIEAGTGHYYSHVIFSDDHGRTWHLGGSTPQHQVNECEVVELTDGRLMLNMRNYDRSKRARQVSTSRDGGMTWSDVRHDETLVEPICQASIRRFRWPATGRPGVILFSNPASPKGRVNMTVRASFDDGRTWPVERVLYSGGSAYSCLVVLPDGGIGCLYERDGYKTITFARITLDWLTRKEETAGTASYSGIHPHLAVFNKQRECGIGAVAPLGDRLWMVTYAPHRPGGSDDKLYAIDSRLRITARPESVGGTPANRMFHEESRQLIIGPYFIGEKGNIRVIPPEKMFGRLTATARHLTDPENKVYFFTMEEGLYEVDVHTLEVTTLFKDAHKRKESDPDILPGYHGKGGYTGQGRLVVSNNGTVNWKEEKENDRSGCLAEWDGKEWTVVKESQFTEVTGPGGISGGSRQDDPLWALGWDRRSVVLELLDRGRWSTFRLPKASFTHDGAHGWHTEWPRIREIGDSGLLMTMHGMFWKFPRSFSSRNRAGIEPLSTYLNMVVDCCFWNGKVVLACNNTSRFDNALAGQAQSNLWFVEPGDLQDLGPVQGFGSVWINEPVRANEASCPFLFSGFDHRAAHLAHDRDRPVAFRFEIDADGSGRWSPSGSTVVSAKGYACHIFPEELKGHWIRVQTDSDCGAATVCFHYAAADRRRTGDRPPAVASLPEADTQQPYSIGLIRPRGSDLGTLHFAASIVNSAGRVEKAGYYEIDETMTLQAVDDGQALAWLEENAAIKGPGFQVDRASVLLLDEAGRRYRLPRGHSRFDGPFPFGQPRCIREVITERSLMNCHGIFYELPRSISGGIGGIKPICTHNRIISDFCSWRGMLVMAGNVRGCEGNGFFVLARDNEVGLWFGAVDDLWALGKPVGRGGPWFESPVEPGVPSDRYLMTGFDRKQVELRHGADVPVTFTIEVEILGKEEWHEYGRVTVAPGEEKTHVFPRGFSAHWVRLVSDRLCRATAQFLYE